MNWSDIARMGENHGLSSYNNLCVNARLIACCSTCESLKHTCTIDLIFMLKLHTEVVGHPKYICDFYHTHPLTSIRSGNVNPL